MPGMDIMGEEVTISQTPGMRVGMGKGELELGQFKSFFPFSDERIRIHVMIEMRVNSDFGFLEMHNSELL